MHSCFLGPIRDGKYSNVEANVKVEGVGGRDREVRYFGKGCAVEKSRKHIRSELQR